MREPAECGRSGAGLVQGWGRERPLPGTFRARALRAPGPAGRGPRVGVFCAQRNPRDLSEAQTPACAPSALVGRCWAQWVQPLPYGAPPPLQAVVATVSGLGGVCVGRGESGKPPGVGSRREAGGVRGPGCQALLGLGFASVGHIPFLFIFYLKGRVRVSEREGESEPFRLLVHCSDAHGSQG